MKGKLIKTIRLENHETIFVGDLIKIINREGELIGRVIDIEEIKNIDFNIIEELSITLDCSKECRCLIQKVYLSSINSIELLKIE